MHQSLKSSARASAVRLLTDLDWGVRERIVRINRVTTVEGEADIAFLLRPTRIEDVFGRSRRGEVMPPKTTYFFPKLLSGLLFYPLER